MIPRHMQAVYCQTCRDKKHAEQVLSHAKRALFRLGEIQAHVGAAQGSRHASPRHADELRLHTPLHKMCGACTDIGRTEHELNRIEAELLLVVQGLFAWLETADARDPKTGLVRQELAAQLRGYYPQAARRLQFIRPKATADAETE